MPRRKQNCPKRMKWEGGEGEPDDQNLPDGEKLEDDDGSTGSMSPRSESSVGPEDINQIPENQNDFNQNSPTPNRLDPKEDFSSAPESPRIEEDTEIQNRLQERDSIQSSAQSRSPTPPQNHTEMYGESRNLPLGPPSPIGVALQATLPPSTGAALLPPSSAAVAAYLGAHRMILGSSGQFQRGSVSPLISSSSSPPGGIGSRPSSVQNMEEDVLDFSTKKDEVMNLSQETKGEASSPLDLSKKRSGDELGNQPPRKIKTGVPQWPTVPYFANVATLSPKATSETWNGKLKPSQSISNDASKALEKMSELSKFGGEDLFRATTNSTRHSAWQSHWLNKGAEQAKDVLKCVWCKQSFPSLAAMTTHMKEAKHCGVNVPVPHIPNPQTLPQPNQTPTSSPSLPNTGTPAPKQDLNLLIKETMPLPRKLVRGQDVWLGKGAEQTRQILKCMWCGQSFRSLAEMTSHMQQTQHYTNIISQEQIISWKSSDDSKRDPSNSNPQNQSGTSSHVSAVLTCKVCDQAFSSLKELSNHMVKNSHYKEHIMRSITESGGRRRQTREKRKKSLPVRKLLELERAQHDFKNGDTLKKEAITPGKITCEKCGDKIETPNFVEHIRQCIGSGNISQTQRNLLKSALMANNILTPDPPKEKDPLRKSVDEPPSPKTSSSPQAPEGNNSPSVLNAIEKLIEKSFDSRRPSSNFQGNQGSSNAPIGSSILKRLGIDETVDYTKPLVDPQTMTILRSYHQNYPRRERSGSESSSISERGSSRVDSLTPDRKMEPPSTPRTTPDKRITPKPSPEREIKVEIPLEIKKELMEIEEGLANGEEIKGDLKDIKEPLEEQHRSPNLSPKSQREVSPSRNSESPSNSDRSGTPRSSNGDKKAQGSLGALSSMFDSLTGSSTPGEASGTTKKGSSHPLAALQKLCDKTENQPRANPTPNSTTQASIPPVSSTSQTPGAILAFSWACNDAVITSDSVMKCAFCDTPFISKGAYRHHLSKMHFIKDGVVPDPISLKPTTPTGSSTSSATSTTPLKSGNGSQSGSRPSSKSPPASNYEESPHSKFLKYTELAKQLSSKYV